MDDVLFRLFQYVFDALFLEMSTKADVVDMDHLNTILAGIRADNNTTMLTRQAWAIIGK